MKLSRKILSCLLPITSIGAIAPVVALSSCSEAAFDISYGQYINCYKKKKSEKVDGKKTYHKIDTLKESVAPYVQQPAGEILWTNISSKQSGSTETNRDFYFDLIATLAIVKNPKDGFSALWFENADTKQISLSLNMGHNTDALDQGTLCYVKSEGDQPFVLLQFKPNREGAEPIDIGRSYMYMNANIIW